MVVGPSELLEAEYLVREYSGSMVEVLLASGSARRSSLASRPDHCRLYLVKRR